ncbi:MAG TPA: NifB/NifX family molybdenum-iron cluster-binding protein [Clostridia bacterium]|jgi:predicted Fe-Mo cluster-binding NifX family protein|nr:NifB/NifX family molybdenum-iron cluster-binding protein [Clostridia bacterium]
MKIAIPVIDKNLNSSVDASFGRTNYFMFYDTSTKESVFVENSAKNNPGGAGIKAAQTIADNGANALIAVRLGQNAANVLQNAEIKIYKATDGSAKDNIDALIANNLSTLSDFHKGFHGRN